MILVKRILLGACLYFALQLSASGQLPSRLKFIENKNQWPSSIDFAARTPGGRLMISPGQFSVYVFDQKKWNDRHERVHGAISEANGHEEMENIIRGQHVQINFVAADKSVKPVPSKRSTAYYNFFLGDDSTSWASRAYAYGEILYPALYPGIDLRITSVHENLKYDFIVHPETDPSVIQLELAGADQLYLDHGNLIMETAVGYLIEKKPYTYQLINGQHIEVRSDYRLSDNCLTFSFPDGYDECVELIIDPLLIFSTFSGSTADNWGSTATPGEHGKLYSSGITNHLNVGGVFPATPGAFQTTYGGIYDIAILKYDSTGSQLLYASYLGGGSNDSPHSLVMDEQSNDLIVLGTTSSFDFPVTAGAYSTIYNGGSALSTSVFDFPNGSDIILSRISSAGDKLLASTYLGGSANDGINPAGSPLVANYGDELRGDVITDTDGNIWIASVTSSSDFPAINSFSTTYQGGLTDAILVKLTADLSAIEWSAFLGGSAVDASHTLKFDAEGNVYLAGGTTSANFPVSAGAYQPTYSGGVDGWIAKIAADGSAMEAATFTGTAEFDQVYFVDLNNSDEVYVYGQTNGEFPVSPGVYNNPNSGQFVQKFSADLTGLVFSTVFGSGIGIPNISPTAFLVNECNNLYMSGWGGDINIDRSFWSSTTHNMPVTSDAIQKTTYGSDFYFMVLTGDAQELLYATYLGGNQSAIHVDGGTSRFDKSGIVYHAVCAGCGGGFDDFPTTPGAWSRTNNSGNCNNAAFKFDLASLRARVQTNSAQFDAPGLDKICFPDPIRFQNVSIGGEFFEWDLGDGTTLTKNDTASFLHQYAEEGTYIVKLKAIDLNTCASVDSTFTVVTVFEPAMNVQDDDVICFGTNYQLRASGGKNYQWRTDDGPLPSANVSPEESTTYYVTVTDANGCVLEDTVTLEVVPFIDLQLEHEFVSDCFSRPKILVRNKTKVLADETYRIDFGDGNSTDQTEVIHEYTEDGTYTIRLAGIKEFCVYEKQVTLPVYTLLVPNVITPGNSPGYNDIFTIQYGEKGRTPADAGLKVDVKIFNRWGTKVYEGFDYQYDWAGDDVDGGVYYYLVFIADQAVCKSWIHVLK
jgi:hypothetical protein